MAVWLVLGLPGCSATVVDGAAAEGREPAAAQGVDLGPPVTPERCWVPLVQPALSPEPGVAAALAQGGLAGSADADADGMSDACELALARAFSPLLRVDPDDDVEGEPHFAVQPLSPGERGGGLRIIYLLAYYEDLGRGRGLCRLMNLVERLRFWARPRDRCAGHLGDSEYILVDVGFDEASRRWRLERVTLSAHWRARWDGTRSLRHDDPELRYPEAPRGPIEVWVAARKHANYASRQACDRGHFGQDSCTRNSASRRLELTAERNVGSRQRPADSDPDLPHATCRRSRGRFAATAAYECFWAPGQDFRGWQGVTRSRRVTPYETVLRAAGF